MRNPSRIYPLLNKIGDIWIKNPDMRLGQLIENITHEYKKKGGSISGDIFYIEDEDFEKLIESWGKK